MQPNLIASSAECVVFVDKAYQRLHIENFNNDVCRVVDNANYIKLEAFGTRRTKGFKVTIKVEAIDEDITLQSVFQFDSKCALCQSQMHHNEHFYTTLSEEKVSNDYASCQHIWTTTSDGKTICRKCANIKLTRKATA